MNKLVCLMNDSWLVVTLATRMFVFARDSGQNYGDLWHGSRIQKIRGNMDPICWATGTVFFGKRRERRQDTTSNPTQCLGQQYLCAREIYSNRRNQQRQSSNRLLKSSKNTTHRSLAKSWSGLNFTAEIARRRSSGTCGQITQTDRTL